MKKILEFPTKDGPYVTQDNREILTHGTDEFRMSVHKTRVFSGMKLALYYHWHDELEIFFVSKGNIRVCVGNKEFRFAEGEILIIPPGVPHVAYREDEGELEFYAVDVQLKFLSSQENDLIQNKYILPVFLGWEKIPDCICPNMEQYPAIRNSLENILNFYQMESYGYELMIKSSLYQILYHLVNGMEHTEKGEENHYNNMWVRQILYFIQSNYKQRITLKDMAAYVNMSESYFCRSVKKVFKVSPMELLNQYRIYQAARLVESTDMKLGEIAFETGFSNINRFTESFKKTMVCTPLNYRQKLKEELKVSKNKKMKQEDGCKNG